MISTEYFTNNESLKGKVRDFIEEWHSDSKVIYVKTSGSTGIPKDISIQKKFMKASAELTGSFLQLQKGQSALLCLSPDTIAGKMMIVRAIVLELNLIVSDVSGSPLDPIDIKIDFAAMVPLQVSNSLRNAQEKFNAISKVIIGGGTISASLRSQIQECDNECYQTYGMTETISHIAMRRVNTGKTELPYRTLAGIEVDSNNSLLVINAPQIGVQNLETNDIVEIKNKTTFKWLGRNDFVINSGGIKIHPEAIEEILGDLLDSNYFSYGIPDILLGQKHILCIESNRQDFPLTEIKSRLDKYTFPKEIYFFDKFIYTESGKINRIKTIEQIADAKKQVL